MKRAAVVLVALSALAPGVARGQPANYTYQTQTYSVPLLSEGSLRPPGVPYPAFASRLFQITQPPDTNVTGASMTLSGNYWSVDGVAVALGNGATSFTINSMLLGSALIGIS